MLQSLLIRALVAVITLGACAACTPNATGFIQISGYDAQGIRTGSLIPPTSTLTPY